MKRFFTFLLILIGLPFGMLFSQVTTIPALPTADAPVTIYLDATTTGLNGYTGDVYAHTGITIGTAVWQNVIGDWGNNTNQPKLIRTATNQYKLEITPSIRQFYSASSSDDIKAMSFVFRSADGTQQTSPDIFVEVFKNELNVLLISPSQTPYFVDPGQIIAVKAESIKADEINLYVDNELITSVAGNSLNQNIAASMETDTKHWIKVVATDATNSVADSTYYYVRGASVVADLPAGVKDGINYIDATTVTLVLHAPYKTSVYAIGDFNDWQFGPEHKLKRNMANVNDVNNRYWVTLEGLSAGVEYAFQYLIDEDLRIADPYADKILDKWNDPYISSTTYPNLKPYPVNKTEGIVSVFQTNQPQYNWQVTNFTAPAPTDLVAYELLLRDFIDAHDFETLIDTLSYIKNLGINAVELMPVSEFEGNLSWGYNPSFYFAPDKYYGPKNTMKAFIDECHANGIAVIMDMVLNHAYGQNVMAQMYWDSQNNRPATNNLWFNAICPHPPYCWGNDFNHESTFTKALVDSISHYWMTEYKIDGFRYDYTKGFTNGTGGGYDNSRIAIIKRMSDAIWEVNPNAYIILEHWCDNSEEKILADYGCMLWGNLNYAYNEGTMGYNENGKSDFSWISYKKRTWNDPHVMGYMESHDEERLMAKNFMYGASNANYSTKDTITAMERMALAATFFYTIPGPKMVWQFGERGFDYSINWPSGTENDRLTPKPPRWDYMNNYHRKYLYHVNAALINLKKNYDVFRTTDFTLDLVNATKSIVLKHSSMDVVVLGNFAITAGNITPTWPSTGTWYEFFTQTELSVTTLNQKVDLLPGEYRLYSSVKIEKPDYLNTGIQSPEISDEENFALIYPNPSEGDFKIGLNISNQEIVKIEVFDMIGNKIMDFGPIKLQAGFVTIASEQLNGNHVKLTPGLYMVKVKTDEKQTCAKLIIN